MGVAAQGNTLEVVARFRKQTSLYNSGVSRDQGVLKFRNGSQAHG